ncbi:MAG: MFS transporter [Methanobrevibacter sp.]|jgi:MFS family permease|nr:MFS transporter [Methanobrevibacter sp.]
MVTKNLSQRDRNLILALFVVGIFMGSLDGGIIGPALPAVEDSFHLTARLSSWMFTTFALFFMIGLPIMAKLSDFYGRRKIYIIDIVLFGIGSLLIAISPTFDFVLIGRALQGFGAGGIFPVASAFIGDYFPFQTRGSALGIIGSVFGISSICSPLLGALLLGFGWHWLFLINIPVVIAIIIASLILLPKTTVKSSFKIDYIGIILFALTSSNLAYGINQIDSSKFIESFFSFDVLPYLLISIILFSILLKFEKKVDEPLLPIELLKNKEMRLATSISLSYGLIQTVVIFIPSLAIVSLFLTIQKASLIMIPFAIITAISAPIIGKLLDKAGSKIIMNVGSLSLAIALFSMIFFSSNLYLFILSEIVMSFGLLTIVGSPLRYIILSETPPGTRGAGQAIVNILSTTGQLVGGALIGALIASFGGRIIGYHISFLIVGIIALFTFYFTSKLKNRSEQLIAIKKNL